MDTQSEKPPVYYTTADLAECIGTSEEVVRKAIRRGLLPAIKVALNANLWRYDVKDTDAEEWIANRRPPGRPRKRAV